MKTLLAAVVLLAMGAVASAQEMGYPQSMMTGQPQYRPYSYGDLGFYPPSYTVNSYGRGNYSRVRVQRGFYQQDYDVYGYGRGNYRSYTVQQRWNPFGF